MKNPEELHEVTEYVLSGLTADVSLKYRILKKAAECGNPAEKKRAYYTVPVFCGLITVLLVSAVLLNSLKPVEPSTPVTMNVFAAGSTDTVPPVNDGEDSISGLFGNIIPEDVVSIELSDQGKIDDAQQCISLIRILLEEAAPENMTSSDANGILSIMTSDGSLYQFSVEEPYLIGQKSCICPAFFSRLHQLLDQ